MHRPQIRHIMWDWNGTLLDDTRLCLDISNTFLEQRNRPRLTLVEYRALFTMPVFDFWRTIVEDVTLEEFREINLSFHQLYKEQRHECELHRGARRFLAESSSAGITHSIVSSHPHEMVREGAKRHRITSYFGEIRGHYDAGACKIELAKEQLRNLSLEPEETLFVGDTVHDFDVAREIGVRCVLVAQGMQAYERLRAVTPEVHGSLEGWMRSNSSFNPIAAELPIAI